MIIFRYWFGGLGIGLEFEPRDLWIGLYWNRGEQYTLGRLWDMYICIIPMLPLHIMFYTDEP